MRASFARRALPMSVAAAYASRQAVRTRNHVPDPIIASGIGCAATPRVVAGFIAARNAIRRAVLAMVEAIAQVIFAQRQCKLLSSVLRAIDSSPLSTCKFFASNHLDICR